MSQTLIINHCGADRHRTTVGVNLTHSVRERADDSNPFKINDLPFSILSMLCIYRQWDTGFKGIRFDGF